MIIAIRRYLKGPGFKVVLWLTLFSIVAFWGGPSLLRRGQRQNKGTGPAVATVNGMEITQSELLRTSQIHQDYLNRVRRQYGQYADLIMQAMGMNPDPKAQALDSLVRDALLDQAAQALRIQVTPGYIEAKFQNPEEVSRQLAQVLPVSVFDETGAVNPAALNRYMARQKLSSTELNNIIKDLFDREMVLELVDVASYVPAFQVKEEFIKESSKKKYSIMTIDFEPVLKKEQAKSVTDEELKKYFDAQNRISKQYWTAEKRNGLTWTVDASKFGVEVTDPEIEEYYQNNKGQRFVASPLKIQARTILFKNSDQETIDKAKKLYEDLVANPGAFAQKAQELSQDEQTAKNGGLVDFFSKGTHDKAFEKAAFLLKNDNDIAEPVFTGKGIEIVQRVAKKAAEYKPLDTVKQEIAQRLASDKFKEQFSETIHNLIDQNSDQEFNKFVDEHSTGKAQLDVVEGDSSKAAKVLFGLREIGNINYFFDGDKAVIVKLTGITKRAVPPLETVKDKVIADLHMDMAKKAFEQLVKEIAAQAVTQPLEALTTKASATVSTTDFIKKDDTKALEDLKKKEVPTQMLFKLEKVGAVTYQIEPAKAFVVRLDALEPFDENAFQEKKATVGRSLERQQSMQLVEGFVASLHRNATLVTSESMVNTAQEDDYSSTDDYL